MSLYVFNGLSDEVRAAMGDVAAPEPPRFQFESAMPAAYVAERMGITLESGAAFIRVREGEIIDTTKGDVVIVEYSVPDDGGNIVVAEAVQVDIGAGAEQMQVVQTQAIGAGSEYVDVVPLPEQPFYSESAISTNPYDSGSEYYLPPPEVIQPQEVYFEVGSTAPVTYGGGQVYTPSQGSTSSPTQDLIGYGELNYDGTEVTAYDPHLQANLSAAYDGV